MVIVQRRGTVRISSFLKKYFNELEYKIIEEKDVKTLGLVAHAPEWEYCTFIDKENFIHNIPTNAKMIITNDRIAEKLKDFDKYGLCITKNPRNLFFKLHNYLGNEKQYVRDTFPSIIGDNCNIDKTAIIADTNVKIGNNVLIEEFVVIRENTKIGDNCIIRSGVKLGGCDFEFKREEDGSIFGVNHYGGVILGKNIEVQYNSGINKALYPWDDTIIDDYTKIDMLVHIAHGVKIGKSCMIVANSGIGGRTIIGDGSWIGFGSTIKNGIKIGKSARINMGSVVTKSIDDGESVSGNFAINHERFIEHIKSIK